MEKIHFEGHNTGKVTKNKKIIMQTKIKENEKSEKIEKIKQFLENGFNVEIIIGLHSEVK